MSEPYREGDEIPVRVLRVMDGDSLQVWDERAHQPVEVRLAGIDAPEIGQRHSQRARRHLERLARGWLVLRVTGIDHRYGRVLGVLRKERGGGPSLNQSMVEAGWAYHYERYAPRTQVLREAQENARRRGRGVWADRDPMRPWDFRRYRRRLEAQGQWREQPRRRRRARWGRRRSWRRRRGRYGLVLPLVVLLLLYAVTRLGEFWRHLPLP